MMVRPTILVVDDIAANRIALRKLLKRLDVDIIEAENGNMALQKAISTPNLALILLDVQMPEMDGYEAAKLLREDEKTHHTPIIFLTAVHQDEEHQVKGYVAGAIDYISKPAIPDILFAKVSLFIEMWQLRTRLELEIEKSAEAERQIAFQARHDQLTQLPNRRQLNHDIATAKRRIERYSGTFSLLFMDLDGFKKINDTHGHNIGDEVLLKVSSRFLSLVQQNDTVARFGGDEFVVLLTDIENESDVIPKAQALVDSARAPIYYGDLKLEIGVSIGITFCHDSQTSIDQLLHQADSAMYEAKNAGKNTYRLYSPRSVATETPLA